MRLHVLPWALAVLLAAAPASAESLSIEAEPDGIRLNLDDVPVEQAVEALSERFDFELKVLRPSEQRLNGSRSGDARQLLDWVLTGHDHAIFMAKEGGSDRIARVVVFGPSGGAPPPVAREVAPDPDGAFPEDGPIEDIPPDYGDPSPPRMDGGISEFSGDEPYDPEMY